MARRERHQELASGHKHDMLENVADIADRAGSGIRSALRSCRMNDGLVRLTIERVGGCASGQAPPQKADDNELGEETGHHAILTNSREISTRSAERCEKPHMEPGSALST